MKSTLPVRGRSVAMAALAAVLLGLLLAAADAIAATGGFSSDTPAAATPVATASMNADRRTAGAPAVHSRLGCRDVRAARAGHVTGLVISGRR